MSTQWHHYSAVRKEASLPFKTMWVGPGDTALRDLSREAGARVLPCSLFSLNLKIASLTLKKKLKLKKGNKQPCGTFHRKRLKMTAREKNQNQVASWPGG